MLIYNEIKRLPLLSKMTLFEMLIKLDNKLQRSRGINDMRPIWRNSLAVSREVQNPVIQSSQGLNSVKHHAQWIGRSWVGIVVLTRNVRSSFSFAIQLVMSPITVEASP